MRVTSNEPKRHSVHFAAFGLHEVLARKYTLPLKSCDSYNRGMLGSASDCAKVGDVPSGGEAQYR
jgi:hypothetical protein